MKTYYIKFHGEDADRELLLATRSQDMASCLFDIFNGKLRIWLKHGHDFQTIDQALEACKEMVKEEIEARDLWGCIE